MASTNNIMEQFKRKATDVVGLDIGENEVRAVRIKAGDEITVVAADVLPGVEIPSDNPQSVPPLLLPSKLKGKYACMTVGGEKATVKLLSFPGHFDASAESKLVQNLGLENPDDYRISYKTIKEGQRKEESRILAAAIPDTEARIAPMLLPSGLPAPLSVEISGLASMSAFLHSKTEEHEGDAIGVIIFDGNISTFAIFNKLTLSLLRRFDIGTNSIMSKVQEALGVDRETAQGIIADGAFDISQSVNEVISPLIKQLTVSRDFVERRENCRISKIYVSGSVILSRDSLDMMKKSMEIELDFWNPFEGLKVNPGALPDNLTDQEWQFSAAVGACLATFEEA